jgi:hypothetical protein
MPRGTNARRNDARARRTFYEAGQKWLNEWEGKDWKRQEFALRKLYPSIGNIPLCRINNAALGNFKEQRLKEVMASTVNKELTLVTTVMNVACDIWEWIDYVPKIRHVKGPQKVAVPLTWEMQDKLFTNLPDW